jgi:hypothetical protein
MIVLFATAGLLGYGLYRSNSRYRKLASDQAELSEQLSRQSGYLSNGPVEIDGPSQPIRFTSPTTNTGSGTGAATEAELAQLRADRVAAETRSKELEERLAKAGSELETLRSLNEETSLSKEQLEKKLKDAEQVANDVKDQLQEIRQAHSKDSLTIAAQGLDIRNMSQKLNDQAARLEQEKMFLEASRDLRDLMVARNFHIADVREVDSKGVERLAFGRVFYTEDTLMFIAFDLNSRNTAKRNASFQVWGKRGSAQSPVHSLGLFQIDDQKQNRWVLRFEDPQILAKIDSVFVTVEPAGGSTKPTGSEFLFAYLNVAPNRQ